MHFVNVRELSKQVIKNTSFDHPNTKIITVNGNIISQDVSTCVQGL